MSEQKPVRDDNSDDYNTSQGSAMLSIFDDNEVEQEDVILTARRSMMREILIRQLSKCADLAGFDFYGSDYFSKYQTSLQTQGNYGLSESQR